MLPPNLEPFAKPIPVLDHGYVMLLDVMGDDDTVVQSARVSYAEGTRRTREDRHLLRYLLRSGHTSPFEQCRIRLEVKLPIFVERQWVRHRTASLNEMSARYSVLPNEFYYPELGAVQEQSKTNKQGRGGALENGTAVQFLETMSGTCASAYKEYQSALDAGVARELARCLLPVNVYTKKVWAMDLHNLLHFLRLRLHPHAQKEIREFAEAIAGIVAVWVPWTWEAFEDYRLKSVGFSRQEQEGLAVLLSEDAIAAAIEASGLKGRERKEFTAKLRSMLPA